MKDRVTRLHPSGFTVVEIMIVIAVIGILAAFAVPNFLAWLPGYQLKSAVRDLQGDFQRARFESIQRGTAVSVVYVNTIAPQRLGYDIVVGGVPIKQVSMPNEVTIQNFPIITYNSRGLINNLPINVVFSNTQGTLAQIRNATITGNRLLIERSVNGGPFQNWD